MQHISVYQPMSVPEHLKSAHTKHNPLSFFLTFFTDWKRLIESFASS